MTTPLARGPRRRAVLAGGAGLPLVALATGCADAVPAPDPRAVAAADAEERGRVLAAQDCAALLARYDATIAAHPPLAARLRPLRAQVAAHRQALAPPAPGTPSPALSAPASASPSASGAPAVPSGQDAALKALADAEQRTAATRTAALRDASPALARLLASVAAAGTCHALLLRGGA
ncbi:hypothetical protein [Streptomyces sp. ICBB 8177]|uniref:hypothetical protein n=1 Tax=Streptomyces sp. ICBB 8177 TaxID=563922 RepID=UPI000D679CBA|nr:hypothetical protein [Streptomyces sp. ICBB 8177]PWI43603.1 hypothetical protein CK485_15900 [Streptomyces sp. ICBB 8177]